MKSYIITNIKHDEYDAEGLKDLFQLYLVKILENKYDVITEYKSDSVIEICNSVGRDVTMIEWKCIRTEVETLMTEFTTAMSFTAYDSKVAVEFLHWDEEIGEGGMMTYRMDFDEDLDEDEMSVKASESLPSKINVLEHMLKDNLVPGSCIEPILTDELDKLHKELHPDMQTEVKTEETPTEVSNNTDVSICRTMNDVIEKMNKLIATVEKLEEKMLNK
jgi:hypothetical protein